ncbi:hypothetical protein [Kitasatospora griseola]|uniref:hypothetical protein n=1 Tax=Kitasatospora griseola TaxID=2064 RepID=UPI003664A1AF
MDDADALTDRIAELESERDDLQVQLGSVELERDELQRQLDELKALADTARDLVRAAHEQLEKGEF